MFKLARFFSSQPVQEAVRSTFKKEASRKTYLVDTYTHVLRKNPIILALHNSTLLKNEDQKFRQDIRNAGANFMVVRSNLFKVALRGLEHPDPASREAHKLYQNARHPLFPLFDGPSAIVSIPEVDPSIVDKVLSLIEKSNSRLILLGGQVDGSVMERLDLERLRKMPTLPELQSQLAGVLTLLSGAGLVNTLESSSKMLYLTLDQHKKEQEKEQ